MALIRLQDKVPNEYVDKSRDFQLLCRLYDVILNGIKYDIDGVKRLVNTHECKSNILQLLQTKLGFFTPRTYTDEILRTILESFPFLVKRKGSRLAIEQTVYMYLKLMGLETEIQVDIINDKPTQEQLRLYGSRVTDHSVVIGIESLEQDVTILRDVLRYIIPFGYNLFFYFFVSSNKEEKFTEIGEAQIILISNDINSSLQGSIPVVDTTYTRAEGDSARKSYSYSTYWQGINDKSNIKYVEVLPESPTEQEKQQVFILKSKPHIAWKWNSEDEGCFEIYPLYQYKSALTQSLINSINLVEVGVHDKKDASSEETYDFDEKKILNIEKVITDEPSEES